MLSVFLSYTYQFSSLLLKLIIILNIQVLALIKNYTFIIMYIIYVSHLLLCEIYVNILISLNKWSLINDLLYLKFTSDFRISLVVLSR